MQAWHTRSQPWSKVQSSITKEGPWTDKLPEDDYMQKPRIEYGHAGISLGMRAANERQCNDVSHWLGAYLNWSLDMSTTKR